jgi:hypothetical protein
VLVAQSWAAIAWNRTSSRSVVVRSARMIPMAGRMWVAVRRVALSIVFRRHRRP